MEQTLTTLALIAAALFSLWILLTDPGSEEGKGDIDTAFLGALLMLPVALLLIAVIILLLPFALAIVLVLAVLYGLFLLLRWFLNRERDVTVPSASRAMHKVADTVRRVTDSGPLKAVVSGSKRVALQFRERVQSSGKRIHENMKKRTKHLAELPRRWRDGAKAADRDATKPSGVRERLKKAYASVTRRARRDRSDNHEDSSNSTRDPLHKQREDHRTKDHRDAGTKARGSDASDSRKGEDRRTEASSRGIHDRTSPSSSTHDRHSSRSSKEEHSSSNQSKNSVSDKRTKSMHDDATREHERTYVVMSTRSADRKDREFAVRRSQDDQSTTDDRDAEKSQATHASRGYRRILGRFANTMQESFVGLSRRLRIFRIAQSGVQENTERGSPLRTLRTIGWKTRRKVRRVSRS